MTNRIETFISHFLSVLKSIGAKIPIVKNIPFYSTLPANLSPNNTRYYKLANLVLTLGLFVHASWIFVFKILSIDPMFVINCITVLVYGYAIHINRKGHYLSASVIMVTEIILHQFVATYMMGLGVGFQFYILVIALLPFLMPRGNWLLKSVLLLLCISSFILIDFTFQKHQAIFPLNSYWTNYFRISNIFFSFVSLCVSGGYFVIAMHHTEDKLEEEKVRSESLLLNILPEETADELKASGTAIPKYYSWVTVMFTDFVDFTSKSEKLSPIELIGLVNTYFKTFDEICARYDIEKIKTIGDAYMCVCGLPKENPKHAEQMIRAAAEMIEFVKQCKIDQVKAGKVYFDIRMGIHSGPVVAGIVGIKKFAYDIWGDTVNTASRVESNGQINKITLSEATYNLLKNDFQIQYGGKIVAKGKGEMDYYEFDESQIINRSTK